MGWILRLMAGAARPYIAGGLAAVLVLSISAAATLGLGLDHAKADLVKARAARDEPPAS
jgi:hypothetical protein